jgi:hypothetical protein
MQKHSLLRAWIDTPWREAMASGVAGSGFIKWVMGISFFCLLPEIKN